MDALPTSLRQADMHAGQQLRCPLVRTRCAYEPAAMTAPL